jgi:CubicO group peptidase (beta-lactamase class C family)
MNKFSQLLLFALAVLLWSNPIAARDDRQKASLPGTALTASDLESWLSGFMAASMRAEQLNGAVVVVVKDGKVLMQRGYGYANVASKTTVDPETTMFRPGSISKLFTWTAIMQLVEQRKINLDEDINAYLDFKIDGKDGKPIRVRDLMTHRAGFQELGKSALVYDSSLVLPLDKFVKSYVPPRIFAPGSTPAYSNYGAALAGYIVQRVSGEPFATYVERHIFVPLKMNHSSFRQPLPQSLLRFASTGYDVDAREPKGYEMMSDAPAGSLAASGGDIAKFMISHLQNGRAIMNPSTASLMHNSILRALPRSPGMALGFYEADTNGHRVIAHGGDLDWFHSDLNLFVDDDIGIFFSTNSAGIGAINVRSHLFHEFANRYFPMKSIPPTIALSSARMHAAQVAGSYLTSRRFEMSFVKLGSLFDQLEISGDGDGILSFVRGTETVRLHEIAPYLWESTDQRFRMEAKMVRGRPLFISLSPITIYQPLSFFQSSRFVYPLIAVSLLILLITALSWPAAAGLRRYYGLDRVTTRKQKFAMIGRGFASWLIFIACVAWLILIVPNISSGFSVLDDIQILATQAFSLFAVILSVMAVLTTVSELGDKSLGISRRVLSLIWIAAMIIALWQFYAFDLIKIGSDF